MNLVELQDVQLDYHRPDGSSFHVLHVPRWSCESEAQVCLRGHSGSGKTSLLNVIAGILSPTHGRVTVDGLEISMFPESQRDFIRGQKIGFIFQTFNLLASFTALENVILGSVFAGDPNEDAAATKQRALGLLHQVGLQDRAHHDPRTLSSGEQQRVAIARALMNRPKLLLADEPTGSLDEANGREVISLIQELAKASQAALILVTHDPVVMKRFDHVVDLKKLNHAHS